MGSTAALSYCRGYLIAKLSYGCALLCAMSKLIAKSLWIGRELAKIGLPRGPAGIGRGLAGISWDWHNPTSRTEHAERVPATHLNTLVCVWPRADFIERCLAAVTVATGISVLLCGGRSVIFMRRVVFAHVVSDDFWQVVVHFWH